MTLTFKLDLDILPLDLHAEIQVGMSVRLAMRVVTDTHTDTQTHTRCQNYYTDVGCKNGVRDKTTHLTTYRHFTVTESRCKIVLCF